MRTGILAASFAALLAIAYGGPTGLDSDASDKHINAIRAVDDANLDTKDHMDTKDNTKDHLKPEHSVLGPDSKYVQIKNNFTGAPPCGDGWIVPGGTVLTDAHIRAARNSAKSGHKFPRGRKPEVCGYQYVVCVRVPSRTRQAGNGFWEIARWSNNGDGTILIALKYWQETLNWSVNGGSAKLYPAHGSVWACAKGNMNWNYEDDHYFLPGNSRKPEDFEHNTAIRQPSWGGPCRCGFNLNTDMELTIA